MMHFLYHQTEIFIFLFLGDVTKKSGITINYVFFYSYVHVDRVGFYVHAENINLNR